LLSIDGGREESLAGLDEQGCVLFLLLPELRTPESLSKHVHGIKKFFFIVPAVLLSEYCAIGTRKTRHESRSFLHQMGKVFP